MSDLFAEQQHKPIGLCRCAMRYFTVKCQSLWSSALHVNKRVVYAA